MTNQHPEMSAGLCLLCCGFGLFFYFQWLKSHRWEQLYDLYHRQKPVRPQCLIKAVGTFSCESHFATFSTLTAEFLLGERAALFLPRAAYHRGSAQAQAQQSLWFRDVESHLIISLGFSSSSDKETFCALLNASIFVLFWDSGQQGYWKCQNCSV